MQFNSANFYTSGRRTE